MSTVRPPGRCTDLPFTRREGSGTETTSSARTPGSGMPQSRAAVRPAAKVPRSRRQNAATMSTSVIGRSASAHCPRSSDAPQPAGQRQDVTDPPQGECTDAADREAQRSPRTRCSSRSTFGTTSLSECVPNVDLAAGSGGVSQPWRCRRGPLRGPRRPLRRARRPRPRRRRRRRSSRPARPGCWPP